MKKFLEIRYIDIRRVCLLLWFFFIVNLHLFAYDFKYGVLYYSVNSDKVSAQVTYEKWSYSNGYQSNYSGNIIIPDTVTRTVGSSYSYTIYKYRVTSIGDCAFIGSTGLASVKIPNSVTSIGNSAFKDCTGLKSIDIPNSLAYIGNGAFSGCTGLASIEIPNSVTTIGSGAFYGTDWYNKQPDGVVYIGNWVYAYKGTMQDNTKIQLKEGTVGIAGGAFYGLEGLESVVFPSSVKYIGAGAFGNCASLTSIELPDSLLSIEDNAFSGCVGLKKIVIPEKVTSIGYTVFRECTGLTSIEVKSNAASISDNAFYKCVNIDSINWNTSTVSLGKVTQYCKDKLSYVKIGRSITNISNSSNPFEGCISLSRIEVSEENTVYDSRKNCNAIIETQSNKLVFGCKGTIIPDDVEAIGDYAFQNCTVLTDVVFPNSLTTIGNSAFSGCIGLSSIVLPNSLTTIGNSAFENCTKVSTMVIPNKVTEIQENAFIGCSFKSITIGANVQKISHQGFSSSPYKVIWLPNTPPTGYKYIEGVVNYSANDLYTDLKNHYTYSFLSSLFTTNGVIYVPVSPADRTCDAIDCVYDSTVNSVIIGSKVKYKNIDMYVTNINPYCFYGNTNVLEVDLSFDGNIGAYAFSNCTRIGSVSVCNNGDIGEFAFFDCDSIKSVVAKNNGHIGKAAFSSCDSILTLIVESKGNIGSNAFNGCVGIVKAVLNNKGAVGDYAFGGCNAITEVSIGDSVTSIGYESFHGCRSLFSVKLGESIKYISTGAFGNCSELQEIIIPNSVSSIGSASFHDCSSLKNISIGSGCVSIGESAFNGCKALQSISIPQSVTSISTNAFKGCYQLSTFIICEYEGASNEDIGLTLGSNGSSPLFSDCPLDSVYIGRNISYKKSSNYGYSPFYRNTSLRSVVITDDETEISENEFYGCTNLKNVNIGNEVVSIGDWAFSGCLSLNYFDFGKKVSSIGKEAFSDCSSMTKIISHALTPPTLGAQALDDINKWDCTLFVPEGSLLAYQAVDQWKDFFFIEDNVVILKYKLTYYVDNDEYASFDVEPGDTLNKVQTPIKEGFTFSGWSEIPATMPANDVEVTGSFVVNSYLLTVLVDGEVVFSDSITYGTSLADYVDLITNQGVDLSQWEFYDQIATITMPAHDVIINAVRDGIMRVMLDNQKTNIYDLTGKKVVTDDINTLPGGIYIINDRKYQIRR